MKTRVTAVLMCLVFTVSAVSCSSVPEEHKGAAVGAGAGAAAGAIAGAIIGDDASGVIIGGLLGALIGGAIGHYAYDKPRSREETVAEYQYEENQGKFILIEEVYAEPQTVAPGGEVKLHARYALLNPTPDAITSITEIRQITHNGDLVGNPEVIVERTDGTYSSEVPLKLPADAKSGLYIVKTTVQSYNAEDTLETSFTVR